MWYSLYDMYIPSLFISCSSLTSGGKRTEVSFGFRYVRYKGKKGGASSRAFISLH